MAGRFRIFASFDTFLIALGIAAAVCMLFPPLALVAAITIIGIPIALLMAVIPALFLFLLTVRAAMLVLPFRHAWVLGVIAAALLVSLPPIAINRALDARAEAFAAGDLDRLGERPLAIRSMAIRSQATGWSRDETRCDEFCIRALLTGALEKVLVAETKDVAAPPEFGAKVLSFALERRDACPAVTLRQRGDFRFEETKSFTERGPGPVELMRLQIAEGNCLIESNAKLGEADAIVTIGRMQKGETPYSAGLDPFADTITADRISVLVRSGATFDERYRWSGVQVHRLIPVLLPSYATGHVFEIRNAFLRTTRRINIASEYYERPDLTAFYTKTLGYDLALDASDARATTTAALTKRLDTPGAFDPIGKDLAEDFFSGLRDRSAVTADEAALAIRIIADRRIDAPRDLWALMRYSKDLSEATVKQVGNLLFSRLMEIRLDAEPPENYQRAEIAARLGGAIGMLPESAVLPHRDDLEKLARRGDLRVPAYSALIRLSAFGASAVPTLLYLIDDADAYREASDHKAWQHPYLAGLIGLCKLGPDGAAAIDGLFARIDSGVMSMHASYGNLAVKTLVGMGADTELIWAKVKTGKPENERSLFDREVRRAQTKPDCTF